MEGQQPPAKKVERRWLTHEEDKEVWGEYRELERQLRDFESDAETRWQRGQEPNMPDKGNWSSSGGAYSGAHRYHLGYGVEFRFGRYSGVNPGPDGGFGGTDEFATQEDFDKMLEIARAAKEAYKQANDRYEELTQQG